MFLLERLRILSSSSRQAPGELLPDIANVAIPKTLAQLVPSGQIPGVADFAKWYDALSFNELRLVLSNPQYKTAIASRVRDPGGLHEWLKVEQLLKFKEWDVPMSEISRFRTATTELVGTIPGTTETFAYTVKNPTTGRLQTGPGAKTFDNELADLTENSTSLADFNTQLGEFLKRWKIDPNLLPKPFPRAASEIK